MLQRLATAACLSLRKDHSQETVRENYRETQFWLCLWAKSNPVLGHREGKDRFRGLKDGLVSSPGSRAILSNPPPVFPACIPFKSKGEKSSLLVCLPFIAFTSETRKLNQYLEKNDIESYLRLPILDDMEK